MAGIEPMDHLHEHLLAAAVVSGDRRLARGARSRSEGQTCKSPRRSYAALDQPRSEGTIRAVGVGMNQAPLLERPRWRPAQDDFG